MTRSQGATTISSFPLVRPPAKNPIQTIRTFHSLPVRRRKRKEPAPPLPINAPIPLAGPPISMGFGQPPPVAPFAPFAPWASLEPFPIPDTDFPAPARPAPALRHRPPPTVQDPLSDAPTQTYQGYRMAKHDLPSRPGPSGASISSAAQLNPATLPPKPESQSSAPGQAAGAAGAGTISRRTGHA